MEYEIKLAGNSESLNALRQDPEINRMAINPWEEIPMETVYYRDSEGKLDAARVMLRQRKEGNAHVVTCKAPSSIAHAREEYEVNSEDLSAAIPMLLQKGAPSFLSELKGLHPVCGAKFMRQTLLLQLSGCKAELALDTGFFFREDRKKDFFLVELELKDGRSDAIETAALWLEKKFALRPEPKSKFQQANEL